MPFIQEEAKKLEVIAEADVVVAGGGPGGFTAAVAAARRGAKTVLLERYGFLGGAATAGLVGPILGHVVRRGRRPILGGIPRELCERLHVAGGALPWEEALKDWGVRFEPEILKVVLDELVTEAGVEVLLHTWVADAVLRDGAIQALVIESKSGRQAVTGKVFVDATGDADVASRAGAPTRKGRPADGRPMAMGSMFRVGGVRVLSDEEAKAADEVLVAARDSGELHVYGAGIETRSSTLRTDHITPNMTRFAGDPTDMRDLTRGEMRVRKETLRIVDFYRRNVPGYADAYLAALPVQLTPRESRQIDGLYVLGAEDIVRGRRFQDVVALGSWWIDIHCPLGRVEGDVHVCRTDCPADPPCVMLTDHPEQLPTELNPPEGGWYDIPYRSLLPRGVSNLLVSGRCISASHQAMAGARVMGTCMAIGEAAGTAAALAALSATPAALLETAGLQKALTDAGVLLTPPPN